MVIKENMTYTTYLSKHGREIRLISRLINEKQVYYLEDSEDKTVSEIPYLNLNAARQAFSKYIEETKEKTDDVKAHV